MSPALPGQPGLQEPAPRTGGSSPPGSSSEGLPCLCPWNAAFLPWTVERDRSEETLASSQAQRDMCAWLKLQISIPGHGDRETLSFVTSAA